MTAESIAAKPADERRYRIAKPNSQPRTAMLIGLDPSSRHLIGQLVAAAPDRRRSFVLESPAEAMEQWLASLPYQTRALTDAIDAVNIVVVIAVAGIPAESASVVAEACRARGIRMTALVVNAHGRSDADVAVTLAHLRPGAAMVVVAEDDAYVADMLNALQA